MEQNRRTKIARLRNLVPLKEGVPLITSVDWPLDGWRFHKNVHLWEEDAAAHIVSLQSRFGRNRVTYGIYFNLEKMRPHPNRLYVGLYVCDVDEIADKFMKSLESWWVNLNES